MSNPKTNTLLTIAARCERAARGGINEDNCLVLNLERENDASVFIGREVNPASVVPIPEPKCIMLQRYGCLLVVADGMGGMNAGEIASETAIQEIERTFSPEHLRELDELGMNDINIHTFIHIAIENADDAIRTTAANDATKQGMGTTIALLWILPNNKAYYAWCGDSRIYCYHTHTRKLEMLSRDHSYVMEERGMSEKDAFMAPDNNIITRSLGDPYSKANPDVVGPIEINKGDLFLLCSDGLCGVLPSRRFDGMPPKVKGTIEEVIQNNFSGSKDLNKCLNSLWITAMQSQWHDNVTILLCHVTKKTEDKAKGRTIPSETSVEPSSTTTSEIDITPEADITSEPETEPKPASDKESSQPLFQKLGAKYVEKDTITPKQIAIAIATSLFILILIISLLFHKAQNRKFRSEDMMLMGTCVPIDSSQQDTTTQLETKYEKQAHESDSTDDISDNWVPGLKLNQDEEAATQAPSTRKDPNKDEKTETEKKKNEPEAEPTVKKGLLDEAIKKRVKQ